MTTDSYKIWENFQFMGLIIVVWKKVQACFSYILDLKHTFNFFNHYYIYYIYYNNNNIIIIYIISVFDSMIYHLHF